MNTLWGYPIKVTMEVNDVEVDVTDCLGIDGTVVIDPDKAIAKILPYVTTEPPAGATSD